MARVQWARLCGYEVIAPGGVQAYRTTRCDRCLYNDEGICVQCDCLIEAKTILATEHCPVGKWSAVWIKRKI